MQPDSTSEDDVRARVRGLEERLARLEAYLGLATDAREGPAPTAREVATQEVEESIEVRLGQNWFANVGIVVLALGVVFLLTLPYPTLPGWLPSLFGYALVGGVVGLARVLRDPYPLISRYLVGGALLLLYFATLRLSHFGTEAALANRVVLVALLLAVVALNLGVAIRRRSPYLAGLQLALGYVTALVSGNAWAVFVITTATTGAAVVLDRRFRWDALPVLGAVAAVLTHAIWAVNNPVLGNPIRLQSSPEANLAFLLLYAVVLAIGGLLRRRDEKEAPAETATALLAGCGSYGLLLLLTVTSFKTHTVAWHLAASLVYLALATLFWIRRRSRYATFVYAMLGYSALSVSIVAGVRTPENFVWLCWQSIVVVSTAVWFRSRFIVVANFAIFLAVFAAYLVAADTEGAESIGFGLVALVSARLLNWQKDRLELKTELMRNAYLASALFVIPYALYHTVPRGLVSVSWLGVAAVYYVFSRILGNRKYRWMALLTTALTVLYVFFVDLVGVNPTVRIISFLVLGTALLVISMVYSRSRRPAESSGVPEPKGDTPASDAPKGRD